MAPRRDVARRSFLDSVADLPLLTPTRDGWAELAAANLGAFLADHAICEQQAALFGLNLVAHYPDDPELVDQMTALAAEEVTHLRRVSQLLHRRGLQPARRRANPYVQALHGHIRHSNEAELKCDRLLVGALIEARSCERFTRLLDQLADTDREVADLLYDLGPAEKRHWLAFHGLAGRGVADEPFATRWRVWLELERDAMASRGIDPTVHG